MSSDDERRALGLVELDGSPGPARPLPARDLDELAARIVDGALAERPPRTAHRPERLRWLFAAAVLGAAGVAGAAGMLATRTPATTEQAPRSPASTGIGERVPRLPRSATSAVHPPVPFEPEPTTRSSPPAVAPSSRVDGAATRAEPATDLLREANRLRARGRWQEAERAYAEVMRGRPGNSESSVAALAAASLRLEHLGDPTGALRLYESVTHQGVLVEEALLGVARCHRAVGNSALEAQTLKLLVARRPQPFVLEEARRRLSELGENVSSP